MSAKDMARRAGRVMPKSVTQVGKHRVKGQEDPAGRTAASLGKLIKSFGRNHMPRRWWWSWALAPLAAGPHAQHPEQQGKAPGGVLMSFVLAGHMCGACGMLGKTTKGLWCFLCHLFRFLMLVWFWFFFFWVCCRSAHRQWDYWAFTTAWD